jgi:hypothetical protein
MYYNAKKSKSMRRCFPAYSGKIPVYFGNMLPGKGRLLFADISPCDSSRLPVLIRIE